MSHPLPWAFPYHDGTRLDMLATSGHLQPLGTGMAPSRSQMSHPAGGPVLGRPRGGRGTQGLGGHMASSLPGEPVPVGSHGTAVPTRLAVISSSRGTCSRPRGDGARPVSSLSGLKHNPVSTHGSPWGQHVFFRLTASG